MQPVPALLSATVMLVRDTPRFEVLMVRRHHEIEFASGALVFPGGKVEPADAEAAWADYVVAPEGLFDNERALRICAIREAFEESGILLAHDPAAPELTLECHAADHRAAVSRGELGFRKLIGQLGLKLDLNALKLFAHWITPAAMKKRFDTRFYLMAAPADQAATCDGCETVDAEWIAPAEALRLREAGQRTIVFPTRLNLALLGQSRSVAEAMTVARTRQVMTIEPAVEKVADGMLVSIPPDAGYGAVAPQRL